MAVNLTQIATELRPGLMAVTGKYDMIPTQYSQVFTKRTSRMAVEISSNMRFLPLAQLKDEGANFAFDNNAGDRFKFTQEHMELGLGYAITRKAIDDNLYQSEFPTSNLGLQNSFQQTKEIMAASVFNNANVYNSALGGDGQPLCSTAHPIDGSTVANRPTIDVDLGESTLLAGMTSVRANFKDQAGLRIRARAKKLIVSLQNEAVAIRLTKSELRPGTSDNDPNAIKTLSGGLPGGYIALDFLTSPFAWFLTTTVDGLLWLQRKPFEMSMHTDFATDNLLVKGYERYSFGFNDPLSLWGSFPTS